MSTFILIVLAYPVLTFLFGETLPSDKGVRIGELFDYPTSGKPMTIEDLMPQRANLLPLFDQIIIEPGLTEEKDRALAIMERFGRDDPDLVFTDNRVDQVSKLLGPERNETFLLISISIFLNTASEYKKLEGKEGVLHRIKESYTRTGSRRLGYLLCRIIPNDTNLQSIIEAGADLNEEEHLELMAACGNKSALLQLVTSLELENKVESLEVNDNRCGALVVLGKARDCRVIAPIVEFLHFASRESKITGDILHSAPSGFAVEALSEILTVYPDIISVDQIPQSEDDFIEWWKDKGKLIQGLDIRKEEPSSVLPRKKIYPVRRPPAP